LARAEDLDLTGAEAGAPSAVGAGLLAVFGVPVYAGRLPATAVDRLRRIKGAGGPAVLVVVYGNRAYEDALLELRDLAVELGFTPLAAGAFVGEHSFSAATTPIAPGRPDADDLRAAREFGLAVAAKLAGLADVAACPPLAVPGNRPYREAGLSGGVSPEVDAALCQGCGLCADICPVAAVRLDEEGVVTTDASACIRCCACVKACPTRARHMTHPAMLEIAQRLAANCRERREPEIFL
jgi:ferredoxin